MQCAGSLRPQAHCATQVESAPTAPHFADDRLAGRKWAHEHLLAGRERTGPFRVQGPDDARNAWRTSRRGHGGLIAPGGQVADKGAGHASRDGMHRPVNWTFSVEVMGVCSNPSWPADLG